MYDSGFPTVPEMPACRPDEFDADQHVIGRLQLYVPKVLCSEGPMFRRFYVQKVLCSEGPMFRRFYVQKVLYSEGSMFRRSYVQKYLFRRSYV